MWNGLSSGRWCCASKFVWGFWLPDDGTLRRRSLDAAAPGLKGARPRHPKGITCVGCFFAGN